MVFSKEITIVLLVKIILIFCIHHAFFSRPVSPHLTPEKFANTLFGPSVSPVSQKEN